MIGYNGDFTLDYRAVQYDDMYNVVFTSDWQSFTFTIANPEISVTEELDGYTYVVDDGMGWISYSDTTVGQAIDKTFTISNDGLETLTLDAGSLTVPDGFSVQTPFASSVGAGETTTLVIRLDAVAEGSFGGDVSFANDDSDESPFDFHIEGNVVPPAPEISVTAEDEWGDQYELASGSDWVYFDNTGEGSPITETFTINNTGTSDLTLDVNSLSVPYGFSITAPFAATVVPDDSTTFTIQLDATQAGYYSGAVSFATDDSDENPFEFYVSGDVTSGGGGPSAEIIVYDALYDEVTDDTGSVDVGQTTAGTPISYTFTIENEGDADLALDAGSLTLPTGFSLVSTFAQTVYSYGQTYLTVQLDATSAGTYSGELSFSTNDADENPFNFTISGDVASSGPSAEIVVLDESAQDVADNIGSVDVGETPVGTAVVYVFTIQNQGDADLTLDSLSLSVPAGFSLVTGFDETVAASGGQTSLTVQLDATSAGAYSGELSFATNDTDENPFNFTVSGDVTGSTNSPPVVVNPIADVTVDEDSANTTIDLSSVFDDPDLSQGDSLTLSVGSNDNQTLVSTAITGQQLTLTYAANGNGAATITVVATDSQSATAQDEITVTVSPVNDDPVTSDDAYQVLHDAPFAADVASGVLANDTDVDGDTLTAIVVSDPQSGTLSMEPDGSFTYTPNPGFLGQDLFAYKVSDGTVETASVPVEITVYNTAPVAAADDFVTGRNRTLTVDAPGILSNDVDLDQETLQITQVSDVANGALTLDGDGSFVYTPDPDFIGIDSFTYFVSDGIADSEVVAVEIEVRNDPPRAAGDSFTVLPGEVLTVTGEELLRNDYDFDGDDLTPSLVKDASHGTLVFEADGAFTYTPDVGFVGFDTFHYQLHDGIDSSQPAVVFLHVDNDKPKAHDRSHRIVHDTTLTVDADSGLLAWASDPDDQTLSVVLVSGVSHGTLTIETDGAYTYVPNASFAGIDSFSYRVTDGFLQSDTATVRIEVANTATATTNDMFPVIAGETLIVEAPGVLQNDVDVDGEALSATLVSDVANGTLSLQTDGSFTYEPDVGFSGLDSFTYMVSDGINQSHATAYVQVIGSGPDDSLHAVIDHYRASHGQTLSIGHSRGVLANDRHPNGDWLDAVLVDNATQGSLTLYDDGSFVYTPTNAAFVGTDTFTYKAGDGAQETAVVTVTIDIVNSAPTTASAAFQVHHDQTLYPPGLGLTEFVADADWDDLTYTVVSGVSSGTLEMGTDGAFTYTPNEGFVGSDGFTYTVNDGVIDSNLATVTIDVTNNVPSGVDLTYHMQHDTTFDSGGVGVLSGATDTDGDVLTAAVATQPGNGTLALAEDGTFTYTPNEDYAGTDSFTFTVNDGAQSSSPSTVTIYVLNETPVSVGATHSVHHGDTLTRWLETWDPDGDEVTYTVTDQVGHGTLTIGTDGQFTYTPNTGYVGDDTFKYTTSDGIAASEPSTVTIHVTNTKPTGIELSYSIHAGESIGFAAPGLLDHAWDANGDDLAVVGQTVTLSHGSLTLGSDGQWSYASSGNSKGTETFAYQVHDGAEASDPATVTIHVTNEPPRVYDQHFFFHHTEGQVSGSNKTLSFNLMVDGYVLDPDEDPVTVSLDSSGSDVTLNAGGAGTVTVAVDFVGEVTFDYVANDGIDDSDPATVTVAVGNSAPRAHDDYFTVRSGDVLQFTLNDLLRNDFDMDGDTLSLVDMSSPSNGSLAYELGFYYYSPGAYTGAATFTYTIEDEVASATATAHIDVVNTAPWTIGRSYQLYEGDTLFVDSMLDDGLWDLETGGLTVVSTGLLPMEADGGFQYPPADPPPENGECPDCVVASSTGASPGYTPRGEIKAEFRLADGLLYNDASGDGDGDADEITSVTISVVEDPREVLLQYSFPNPYATDFDTYVPEHIYLEEDKLDMPTTGTKKPDGVYWVLHGEAFSANVLDNHLYLDGTAAPVVESVVDANGIAVPLNGSAAVVQLDRGQVDIQPDGQFTYTPNDHFAEIERFEYNVTAGDDSDTAVVNLVYHNHPPEALSDGPFRQLHGFANVTGNVLANDVEVDAEPLFIASITDSTGAEQPIAPGGTTFTLDHGQVEIFPSGDFTYTPHDDFSGKDRFKYTLDDGKDIDSAWVEIVSTNQAPVAFDDEAYVAHYTASISGNLLDSVFDGDGDTLRIETFEGVAPDPSGLIVIALADGTMTVQEDGDFLYTPAAGSTFVGGYDFNYVVTDGADSDTAETQLVLYNQIPKAHDETIERLAGFGSLDYTATADEADGENLTFTLGSAGAGTVALNPDPLAPPNSYIYTPASPDWTGTDSFSYTVSDGAASTTAQVTIQVDETTPPPADPPVVAADDQGYWWGGDDVLRSANGGELNVLGNDSPDPYVSLEAIDVSPAAGSFGTLTINADGTARYVPHDEHQVEAFYSLEGETFQYTVSDGVGNTNTAEITVQPFELGVGECASWGAVIACNDIHLDGQPLSSAFVSASSEVYLRFAGGEVHFRSPGQNDYRLTSSGDARWIGPADSVYLGLEGSLVASIDIQGTAEIDADLGVGDVRAENVHIATWLYEGYDDTYHCGLAHVGRVVATDEIYYIQAMGSIASTYSGGDTALVFAMEDIGPVYAGMNVGGVYGNADVSDVTAEQAIGHVHADYHVVGDITAKAGSIGDMDWHDMLVEGGLNYYSVYYGTRDEVDFYSDQLPGGIIAGGEITGNIHAGVDVKIVHAREDIQGAITAGQDIFRVRAELGQMPEITRIGAGRDVGTVDAEYDFAGEVKSGRDIGVLRVGFDLADTAGINGGRHFSSLLVGQHIFGDTFTQSGSITYVRTGYESEDQLFPDCLGRIV